MVQSIRMLRPLTSPIETGTVTADFGPMLAAGVRITACQAVTMSVEPNVYFPAQDANAMSRILSAPVITASPSTGAPNAAILVMCGNLISGVRYAIEIVGVASDGTHPTLWQYWPADYPGMPGT